MKNISPNYYLAAFLIWAMFMELAYLNFNHKSQKKQLNKVYKLRTGNCLNVDKAVSDVLLGSYTKVCQGNNCRVCKK